MVILILCKISTKLHTIIIIIGLDKTRGYNKRQTAEGMINGDISQIQIMANYTMINQTIINNARSAVTD